MHLIYCINIMHIIYFIMTSVQGNSIWKFIYIN